MLVRNFLALEKAPFLFSLCLHGAFFSFSYYGLERSVEKHYLAPLKQIKINAISVVSLKEVPIQIKETPNKEQKKRTPPRSSQHSTKPMHENAPPRPMTTHSKPPEHTHTYPSQQHNEKRLIPRPMSAEYILGSPQNPLPDYPLEALQNGYEGTVHIRVKIDKNGMVLAARIDKSSEYGCLDAAALAALKAWVFKPGHIDNKSIESELTVPIKFVLDDPT